METTEKIVESYCRYVKGWFTIPNIKCGGQLEIDLLAVDVTSRPHENYHIETSVSVSDSFSKLSAGEYSPAKAKERLHQASQRRTIGFFIEKKFGAEDVMARLAEFGFEPGSYKKVIVTMGWKEDVEPIAEQHGILLWDFRELLKEIATTCRHQKTYFIDDTLRTIQLYMRSETKQ